MITIRSAHEDDLPAMHRIFYENEVQSVAVPPPPGDVSPVARHILKTGTVYVAEQDGHILAFAGAITRGAITFLADLFVKPTTQSGGLGKSLLNAALPQDGLTHFTVSSTDPRAQALYIRSGMAPAFPHFNLRWHKPSRWELPSTAVTVVEGESGDQELIRWDARIGGRERPVDHAFWIKEQKAVPLWFLQHGKTIGYGYARLKTGSIRFPELCTIGPIGVNDPDNAAECILAAVSWASQHATMIRIDVPGPHPCLAPLLGIGFHIVYVELFVSAAPTPFFDPRCYIPSGSDLF